MCGTAQLSITTGPVSGGLSHEGIVVVFTDQGPTCTLQGYPGVDGQDQGATVVEAARTLSGYLGGLSQGASPPLVTLQTGQSASAMLEGLDGGVSGQPCPTYTSLLVTPPNQTTSVSLPASTICSPQIHPVVPGTTGDSTTPGPTPPTTTAPGTAGACDPRSLQVTLASEGGAGGSGYYTFQAVNAGAQTCQAGGYFGVSIYDQAGTLLSTSDSRETSLPHSGPVGPVPLAPGAST
jgi:hypothetical protein